MAGHESYKGTSNNRYRQAKARLRRRKQIQRNVMILVVLILAVLFGFTKYARAHSTFTLDLPGGESIKQEYGEEFTTPSVKAVYKTCFGNFLKKKVKATVEGDVDVNEFGTYELTYTATYRHKTITKTQTVEVVDEEGPKISLVSDPEHYTSPVGTYEEEGYTAIDNHDGDVTDQVKVQEKDGKVYYTVTDSFGNESEAVREIIYKDVVKPKIKLKGKKKMAIQVGSKTGYEEPGYKATDDVDGNITDQVKVSGDTVDTSKMGKYTIKYSVEDSSGNKRTVKRVVVVKDTTAPVITLKGDQSVFVKTGSDFEDPGYTAEDNLDGDITDQVTLDDGGLDTSKKGWYTLTYTVKDSSGNKGQALRYVEVADSESELQDPESKVIYLTFDDGPGPYTEKLLDILDKYNVKATFFVTAQFPDYLDMIGEEAKRGHTVAIHTYSHNFSIYKSVSSYMTDLEKMQKIVVEQTGQKATFIRFPGGSSNTVSAKYCKGIMSTLTKYVEEAGYIYEDWNVTSGDAGETTSTTQVYKNVIREIQMCKRSVVLQHDIHDYSVDAVESIIKWGLKNGYTFLPLTQKSAVVHHGVNN